MPINLADFERGAPFAGDYHARLKALQDRLGELQLRQIVHKKRAIVIFEGWVGSGKGAALQRMVAGFNPCHIAVHCTPRQDALSAERHWLAPFWEKLPAGGNSAIFFRSWYRQMSASRLGRHVDDKGWHRMLDEVNEFESQQKDHGTLIVKMFLHLSAEEQLRRLRAQAEDPWARHLLSPRDFDGVRMRGEVAGHLHELFGATDTRWAPWTIIDAGDAHSARISVLETVAAAMDRAFPKEPPAYEGGAEIVAFPGMIQR